MMQLHTVQVNEPWDSFWYQGFHPLTLPNMCNGDKVRHTHTVGH